jgi:hypothetical protein
VRALVVLGLTESVVEMMAFVTPLAEAGWRAGGPVPSGALLQASGAAFTAVVAGQIANAFVCRSATLRLGERGWFSNYYLVLAVICEAGMLAGFLYLRPLANILGHAAPSPRGYLAASLAMPAVLAADAIHKRYRTGAPHGGETRRVDHAQRL